MSFDCKIVTTWYHVVYFSQTLEFNSYTPIPNLLENKPIRMFIYVFLCTYWILVVDRALILLSSENS